jgi:hypothetical protein
VGGNATATTPDDRVKRNFVVERPDASVMKAMMRIWTPYHRQRNGRAHCHSLLMLLELKRT